MICMSRQSCACLALEGVTSCPSNHDLAGRGLDQAQDAAAGGGFAAAGLADQTQCFAPREFEAHAVDRAHLPAARGEQTALERKMLDQILDAQAGARASALPSGLVQHAGDLVAGGHFEQRRRLAHARIARKRAARREAAARRRIDQASGPCRRSHRAAALRRGHVDARDRPDQALRVGMAAARGTIRPTPLPRRCCPRTSPTTRCAVSATTPIACVIRSTAMPIFSFQFGHQVQNLGLYGHVERRRGLIGDQQSWTAGQGHRDHHALAHAAENWCG